MSLRRTFILVFSALLTALAAFAAAFSYYSARNEAWGILDFQLQQIAHVVGDGSSVTPMKSAAASSDEVVALRIIPQDGQPPITNDLSVNFPEPTMPGFSTFSSGDVEWRLYADVRPERTVLIAQRTAERDELAAAAAWNSAWPFLLAIPLSWIVGYWLVGAIMQRLQVIATRVEARAVEDTEPLAVEDAPLEVRPLVTAINSAFDRVKATLEQQRAFLADAAHELRTPVTALSLQISNLKQATGLQERDAAIAELEAGVRRAKQVATQLLGLARSESADGVGVVFPPAKLLDAVKDCLGRFLVAADAKRIDLGLMQSGTCSVRIDPVELAAILDVVVDNALRYTPEGGQVDLAVKTDNLSAIVTVTDDGPGIPDQLRERVFDRFFRVDSSTSDGTGLGLAIARNLVGRYGGTIRLTEAPDGSGLRVALSFPLA
ncbi:histidine kinase [Rhizobium sp. Root708]|uniref:sensor histidine kinase n=1 Tax=Rhizobium sp. Root708 TaxID=1736592 RepID=UPI0006FF1819|nr:ATP-binding protein [Rhizobium sp. Root708]KRB61929.1 histidine kinase [Rhizobium sp. Root708]